MLNFFENVNFSSSYKGESAHQIWLNLGQGKTTSFIKENHFITAYKHISYTWSNKTTTKLKQSTLWWKLKLNMAQISRNKRRSCSAPTPPPPPSPITVKRVHEMYVMKPAPSMTKFSYLFDCKVILKFPLH